MVTFRVLKERKIGVAERNHRLEAGRTRQRGSKYVKTVSNSTVCHEVGTYTKQFETRHLRIGLIVLAGIKFEPHSFWMIFLAPSMWCLQSSRPVSSSSNSTNKNYSKSHVKIHWRFVTQC